MFRRSIWRLGSLICDLGGSTCWNTPITGRAVNADSGACLSRMLYYTVGQWYALCYMIICGVIMGLVCEIFDVVRALTKAGQVFGATLDVIMCAALAVLATVMLVQAVRLATCVCTLFWAAQSVGYCLSSARHESCAPRHGKCSACGINFGCMLEIFHFSDIFLNKCFGGRIWRICGE